MPFGAITSGHLRGADLALSQLTPTKERDRSLDFTGGYLDASAGVLARRGVEAADLKGLRGLHWVVSRLSTLTPTLMNRVRPTDAAVAVEDRTAALGVLRAGKADALLLDLPVALGLARSDPARLHVVGQLETEEVLAAALPDGSKNVEVADSAIRHLQADGTIDRLAKRWLGAHEDDVPLIPSED